MSLTTWKLISNNCEHLSKNEGIISSCLFTFLFLKLAADLFDLAVDVVQLRHVHGFLFRVLLFGVLSWLGFPLGRFLCLCGFLGSDCWFLVGLKDLL